MTRGVFYRAALPAAPSSFLGAIRRRVRLVCADGVHSSEKTIEKAWHGDQHSPAGDHLRSATMHDHKLHHSKSAHVSVTRAALLSFSIAVCAQTSQGAEVDTRADAADSSDQLAEVVVSAEKRQSTVQETPISITAITGEDLEARGLTNLVSVTKEAPGISFRSAGPGQTEFEMRGVSSTGGSVGTVGFYLDETPFTPPSFGAIGKVVIDPNLYDLQSVEVLRGPQGTLYGAGSMGGTIRVLTKQPNLHEFDASADVTGSGTDGGGFNRSGDLMLNIPLINDVMALRLVGSTEYRDGWLDRIVVSPFPEPTNTGCVPQEGWAGCARGAVTAGPSRVIPRVNWERLNTLRPSLLIKPTDELSISISALYQRTTMGGYDNFDIPPGCDTGAPCGHYQPFDVAEPFSDLVRLLSTVIHYDTSTVGVTSATSYWTRNESQAQDASEALESALGPPFVSAPLAETDASKQLSEELRLASNGGGAFQWLVGVFYSDFKFVWDQSWYSDTFAIPTNPAGAIYVAHIPYDTKQYAAFTEESYKITSDLKFTAGLRAFRYQSDASTVYSGLLTPSGDGSNFYGSTNTSAHGLNPKFNLSYAPTHDLTLYGTAAKGFRPGGISEAFPQSCVPGLQAVGLTPAAAQSYGPDSLWNYELGEKARLMDGLSGTYTNAVISTGKYGITDGQPLLNIPKYTASLSLDYRKSLPADMTLTGHLSESVVGPEWDISYEQAQLPSYALMDARVALNRRQWTATLFVDNATNRLAIQTINNTFFSLNIPSLTRATMNQPRTIGVKIGWQLR
jgi:outer membrane receptor protein involved in Fe transport